MKHFCAFFMALLAAHAYGGNDLLTVGSAAPLFSLASSDGDTVKLLDFRDKKNIVLVFYPGDQTPGCTKQLCALRDDYSEFGKKDAVIFGVNPADVQSHRKFIEKQHYQFPLLVDEGKAVAKLYGTSGLFIKRTVYVIDKKGIIIFAQRGMPSDSTILASIPGK
jgi:thioredoxin-dependent peroxiredoxin